VVASGSVTSGWQPLRSRPVGPTTMVRAVTSQREGQPEPSGPRAASSRLSGLLRIARPRHWVKNLLVFAAPAAAGVLSHGTVAAHAAGAFGVFCLAASGSYFVNDTLDVEADRHHPVKRLRPVAAGIVPGRLAVAVGSVLMAGAIGLAWLLAGSHLAVVIAVYVAVTTAYSLRLKHEPVVDLACVSAGFVLRAIAGGVATGVPLSDWFIIVSSFGALLIVTGKRSAEHLELGELRGVHRPTLLAYPEAFLRSVRLLSAAVTVTAYCLWAFERSAQAGRGHHPIWFELSIVPFVIAILHVELRFARGMGGAPEELALQDRMLQLLGLVWVVLVAVGIYA
jgi:decaprenyl-phosphate phosphoribosyltransferase